MYQLVQEQEKIDPDLNTSGVLRRLKVSKSGYYAWKKREKSQQQIHKEEAMEKIQDIYEENHKIYGAPKITIIMNREGFSISQKTVSNYMKELNIKAIWVKPYTKTTLNSDFSTKLENISNRDFNPKAPDEAWCTDITYIWTVADGFVYLTSVMDLYSRKIIAWTLTQTLVVDEVLKCIEIAKERRKIENPLIMHADRGVHFICELYQRMTKDMIRSYSEKGNPWDNACIESFHSLIKREWLNRKMILDYNHAYDLCFEYIEAFYNTRRIHSFCEYESPSDYEKIQAGQKS